MIDLHLKVSKFRVFDEMEETGNDLSVIGGRDSPGAPSKRLSSSVAISLNVYIPGWSSVPGGLEDEY